MDIRIEFGKPYRGFGATDPRKTRDEREQELDSFMPMDFGLELFVALASKASGHPLLRLPPPGTTASQLIQTILEHEYPNG